MANNDIMEKYRKQNGLNFISLRGTLCNWTKEDIVKVATDNIKTIIKPIEDDLDTDWDNMNGENIDNKPTPDDNPEFEGIEAEWSNI